MTAAYKIGMTSNFDESNVVRDAAGKFGEKSQTEPEVSLNASATELAKLRNAFDAQSEAAWDAVRELRKPAAAYVAAVARERYPDARTAVFVAEEYDDGAYISFMGFRDAYGDDMDLELGGGDEYEINNIVRSCCDNADDLAMLPGAITTSDATVSIRVGGEPLHVTEARVLARGFDSEATEVCFTAQPRQGDGRLTLWPVAAYKADGSFSDATDKQLYSVMTVLNEADVNDPTECLRPVGDGTFALDLKEEKP